MPRATTAHAGNRPLYAILLACFFISGACGLIYEVVWLRVLGLIFGNTVFATSAVLACFMAGLGLGALVLGRWIDARETTHSSPIRIYALLEAGVGLYGLISPLIWTFIKTIHTTFYQTFSPSPIALSLFKFAIAFLVIFLPTFLMGGTLPVIARFFAREKNKAAGTIGLLYALNAAGAVLGVLASGFYLLYAFGVWQTMILSASGYLAVSLIALFCAKKLPGAQAPQCSRPEPAPATGHPVSMSAPDRLTINVLLGLFGLSGALAMLYEVAWTRILAVVLASSVYAFSIMLATFLLGIALGSFGFSWICRKIRVDLLLFAILQLLTAFFVLIGLNQLDHLPYDFARFVIESEVVSWMSIELSKLWFCARLMLPATICIGAMFACFIHLARESDTLGKLVGKVYLCNTLGNVLGSALTGFFIIPILGIRDTLLMGGALNAAIGLVVFLMQDKKFQARRLVAVGGLLTLVGLAALRVDPWDKGLIVSGMAHNPLRLRHESREKTMEKMSRKDVVYYREGLTSTVSVTRFKNVLSLAVNGKVDASTGADVITQYLLGHLPMQLNPDAKKVLVIGLGSGATAAAVATYPVAQLDIVEIEAAVVEAAQFFTELNRGVLDDARVHTIVDDGRNYLAITPHKYDVIISEPSNPWMAGIANLYSYEHFKTMSAQLAPGGFVCQWLQAYRLSTDDLRMVMRTFANAFDGVSLWTSGERPDLLLIGSNEPQVLDFKTFEKAFENPYVKLDLGRSGLEDAAGILAFRTLGDPDFRKASKDAAINYDNHPLLEYAAPRSLYEGDERANMAFLFKHKTKLVPLLINLDPPAARNASYLLSLAKIYSANGMLLPAETTLQKAGDLAPENPIYLEAAGILAFKKQDYSMAQKLFSHLLGKNPNAPVAHFYLGSIYFSREKFKQALDEYLYAINLVGDKKKMLQDIDRFLRQGGAVGFAGRMVDGASQLKGVGYTDLEGLTTFVLQHGPDRLKKAVVLTLLQRYSDHKQMYTALGQDLLEAGLLPQAEVVYKTMTQTFPENARGYSKLAEVYRKLGKRQQFEWASQTADGLSKKN